MERSSSTVATTRFSARGGPSARAEARGSSLSQPHFQQQQQQKAKKQGGGPRLNDVTRLEIIELLNAPNRLSLRKIGAQFGVCEATIRHIRDRSSAITSRALAVPEDVRRTTLRVVQKTFPELEELLAQWLESEIADRRDSDDTVSEPEPEVVMRKAEEIAAQLSIPEHEFSASKIWFKNFQRRRVAKDVARDKAQLEAAARALVPSSPSTDLSTGGAIAVAGEKKRKRGSGPRLSDGQRLEIIEKLRDPNVPASNRKLAEEYKVDEATIRHIKLNAERLRERALNASVDVRQTTFRAGKAKFTELETILAEWIDVSRRCNEEIPPPVVRRKAEEVAVELDIPEGEFKATLSWYASFCRRQGIGPVTPINNLEEIVAEYDPSNVFTVDETGLFYRLLPRHDELIPSSQPSSQVMENAELMDRVSLVLCCNATGSERLPVSMISKEQSPKCKSSATDWPLPYFHQSKAWMDTKVFTKWFDEVFVPYIAKRPRQQQRQQGGQDSECSNSKVLLLLDNAPGHPVNFEKGDIRVLALHPKSTAWMQPLEMGVITALKNRYKLRVLSDILAYHALPADIKSQLIAGVKHVKKGTAGVFFGQAPHLLDAARRIADAWNAISPELLKCAFEEANFIPQFKSGSSSRTSKDNSYNDNQATAIRIEAEEFKLEEDMFKALRDFCLAHRRVQGDGLNGGSSVGDVSDAELAEELQTFLHLDDESSHVYQKCIMDDIDRAATEDSEASGSSFNDDDDDDDVEPEVADAGSTSNTMNRILNGSASSVSASDVFNTTTLLGMQLRQLRASREFDAKQIEEAVVMTDSLRHQLQEVSCKKPAAAAVAVPVVAATNGQQQQTERTLLSTSRIPAHQVNIAL